jgi:hypothetical protein
VALVLGLAPLLPALGQEEGDKLRTLVSKLSADEFSVRKKAVHPPNEEIEAIDRPELGGE